MIRINSWWVRSVYVLFALSFAVEQASGFTISALYKYIFFGVLCFLALLILLLAPREEKIIWDVMLWMGACTVVFILVSLVGMFFNGFRLYPEFTRDLFRLIGPAVMAFLIYNVERGSGENAIDFYFGVFFATEVIQYFFTIVLPQLSLSSILSISLSESYSPFETTQASRFTICLFYYILRKKPFMSLLALIASLLSFKRFNLLFSVVFVCMGWVTVRTKKRVSDRLIYLTALAFCLAPLVLMLFVSDSFVGWFEGTFDQDYNQFTMGRFEQFRYIFQYEGSLIGLGSTKYMLAERFARGGYAAELHSDLQRFYVETTIVGLCTYVVGMFSLIRIRRRYYTYVLMVFIFTLMLITPQFGDFPTYLLLFLICQTDFDAMRIRVKRNERTEVAA